LQVAALRHLIYQLQVLNIYPILREADGVAGVQLSFQPGKYFLWTRWIGAALMSTGALAPPCFGAQSPESIFNCTNLASGAGWQIKINFHASTVDSNPARISNSTISWHDPTDGGNYSLDRSTGNLTVVIASSTGGYFIHDRCRPRG
jgi:hypothetical protein